MQKCPLKRELSVSPKASVTAFPGISCCVHFLEMGSAMLIGSGIVSPLYIFSPPWLGIFRLHCLIFKV